MACSLHPTVHVRKRCVPATPRAVQMLAPDGRGQQTLEVLTVAGIPPRDRHFLHFCKRRSAALAPLRRRCGKLRRCERGARLRYRQFSLQNFQFDVGDLLVLGDAADFVFRLSSKVVQRLLEQPLFLVQSILHVRWHCWFIEWPSAVASHPSGCKCCIDLTPSV